MLAESPLVSQVPHLESHCEACLHPASFSWPPITWSVCFNTEAGLEGPGQEKQSPSQLKQTPSLSSGKRPRQPRRHTFALQYMAIQRDRAHRPAAA